MDSVREIESNVPGPSDVVQSDEGDDFCVPREGREDRLSWLSFRDWRMSSLFSAETEESTFHESSSGTARRSAVACADGTRSKGPALGRSSARPQPRTGPGIANLRGKTSRSTRARRYRVGWPFVHLRHFFRSNDLALTNQRHSPE